MLRPRSILTFLLLAVGVASGQAQDAGVEAMFKRMSKPVYGRNCGIVGEDPAPRTQLEGLLLYRDPTGVVGMLFDKDPVFQVYGAEGVIRLQRSGMTFPENVVKRVEALRQSKKKINVCSGCSHWEEPIDTALGMFLR
jgi:hypothetical protein